jgi:hypothetical protein
MIGAGEGRVTRQRCRVDQRLHPELARKVGAAVTDDEAALRVRVVHLAGQAVNVVARHSDSRSVSETQRPWQQQHASLPNRRMGVDAGCECCPTLPWTVLDWSGVEWNGVSLTQSAS